jgi:hypothetical protein
VLDAVTAHSNQERLALVCFPKTTTDQKVLLVTSYWPSPQGDRNWGAGVGCQRSSPRNDAPGAHVARQQAAGTARQRQRECSSCAERAWRMGPVGTLFTLTGVVPMNKT